MLTEGLDRLHRVSLAACLGGLVERGDLITGKRIEAGDVILGLASSGVHSNGFSMVRKVVELAGLSFQDGAPFSPDQSLGDALLTPTRLYVRSCLEAMKHGLVKGAAHITGGGLLENLPRILPDALGATLEIASWPRPPVFTWLQTTGGVEETELLRTFNCGIGMAVIVGGEDAANATALLESAGETVYSIGKIVPRADGETPIQVV